MALTAPSALSQGVSEVTLDANPSLFAVLTAARAAAQGAPAGAPPVLARVDAALAQLDPAAAAALREFFQEKSSGDPGADWSAYISLGLLLQPAPEFGWLIPDNQLPPDVWPLRQFPSLLRDFYAQARLGQLWRVVRPAYERALTEHRPAVARTLLETRAYLRLIEEGYPGRSYTIYLEWLVPPTLVSARSYGGRYSLVVHPQHTDLLQAVRHQYLHFLLDPLASKYAEALRPFARLQPVAAEVPHLPRAFRDDVLLLATECLIKAMELRLADLEPAAATAKVTSLERAGYLFVRHFFWALDLYEKSEPSIRFYFPELPRGFNAEQEQARLKAVEYAPLPAEARETGPVEAQPEPAAPGLLEAERSLAEGKHAAARELFESVLREQDPNQPRALYGLALIASVEQDRPQAKHYFLRTLEQARAPHILGWTHVYLGRIYDLEGNRQQALTHYRAALAVNPRLQRVEQAAQRGLERPFGEQEETSRGSPRF